jgi:hypothetical protein
MEPSSRPARRLPPYAPSTIPAGSHTQTHSVQGRPPKFNLCRIYLQVLTLSDIATSSGREIDIHFWRGHRSSRKSSLKWSHQIRPSNTCWAIWRKTLHLLFTDSVRSTRILPAHCLHSWLPNSPYHQLWPTHIDPSTSLLYTKLAGGSTYIIYSPRNGFSYYPTPATSFTLPTESFPITVTRWLPFAAISQYAKRFSPKEVPKTPCPKTPHSTSPITTQVNTRPTHNTPMPITQGQLHSPIHRHSHHPRPHIEAPSQVPQPATTQTVSSFNSFQDHLQSLPSTETFFLGNISIPSQLHKLVSDIHNSCFAMASDGSVRSPNGSFAWVLYGTESQIRLTGHNTLTGGHLDLSTFQAEACS